MFARLINPSPAHPATETLQLDGLPMTCRLVRSRRKSLAVHVRHDQIEVRAPWFVGRDEALRFLDRHRGWVLRKWREKQQRHAETLTICHGGDIYWKARNLRIELVDAPRPAVTPWPSQQPDTLRIAGPGLIPGAVGCEQRAAQILQKSLQASARAWLPTRTQALAEYLGVGDKLRQVVFRKTRSKWGHCTVKGVIQYNWLIMLAPDGVIDYMIAHEVCHLLHMNHSAEYWQAVARVCPDYKRYVGWLKQHEHRLWF